MVSVCSRFFFALKFRVFNPSLFETNFRTLLRENTFARAKRSLLFTRKKRTKVSERREQTTREVVFLLFLFLRREKSAIVLVSLCCFCELYNTHQITKAAAKRDEDGAPRIRDVNDCKRRRTRRAASQKRQ